MGDRDEGRGGDKKETYRQTNRDRLSLKLSVIPFFQNMVDVLSDVAFVVSTVDFVRDLANAKAKTSAPGRPYLYLFNHYPDFKAGDPEPRGTSHGEDIAYLFDLTPEVAAFIGFTSNEYTISSTFRTMLTSFAKTG